MLVAGSIAIAELTISLHDLPRAAREANQTAARVFGTYLSASLDNRVGDILQLAHSTLVWTALSDSRDRDVYLRPFLKERNAALPNSRLAILDYRGRFVAGDEGLLGVGGAPVDRLVKEVLAGKEPATRLVSKPGGGFWIAAPIDYPYTHDVIGVLLCAIDLEAMLGKDIAEELRELGVVIRGPQTTWRLRGEADSPVFAPATYAIHSSDIPGLYDLELSVHATSNPWRQELLLRIGVLVLVSVVLALLIWWVAGLAARPVSRRLERLAAIIVDNPSCAPEDIPPDASGDEIAALGDALRHALIAHRDAQQQLERLAYFDKLTGLMNRARFDERLRQALERAQRNDTQIALLFIDLDRFKAVNDSLGHEAGDELLCEVASRIGERVRRTDAVSRRSGDEFTVLVESYKDQKGVAHFAEDLIVRLSKPYQLGSGASVVIGASVGIAFYPADADNVGQLLQCADTAMYAAT